MTMTATVSFWTLVPSFEVVQAPDMSVLSGRWRPAYYHRSDTRTSLAAISMRAVIATRLLLQLASISVKFRRQLRAFDRDETKIFFYLATLCSRAVCCHRVSVRPSVRRSHAGIAPKQLNVGSCKQHHTTARGLQFSGAKNLGEIPTGSQDHPNGGAKYRWCMLKSTNFDQYLAISQQR